MAALVKVGVNDFWTVRVPVESEEKQSPLASLVRHSRVCRLACLLIKSPAANLDVQQSSTSTIEEGSGTIRYDNHVFEVGWQRAGDSNRGSVEDLKHNLTALSEKAKKRGVKLVFLNYASNDPFYRVASDAIDDVARKTQTPIIDLRSEFGDVCSNRPDPKWIYADGHPRAAGYELIAETIMQQLPDLLHRSEDFGMTPDEYGGTAKTQRVLHDRPDAKERGKTTRFAQREPASQSSASSHTSDTGNSVRR